MAFSSPLTVVRGCRHALVVRLFLPGLHPCNLFWCHCRFQSQGTKTASCSGTTGRSSLHPLLHHLTILSSHDPRTSSRSLAPGKRATGLLVAAIRVDRGPTATERGRRRKWTSQARMQLMTASTSVVALTNLSTATTTSSLRVVSPYTRSGLNDWR